MAARSIDESSSSAPASLASTSAGVRAPISAVLIAGCPSTHASAIWLTDTPRGSATSRRIRSTTPTFVLKLSAAEDRLAERHAGAGQESVAERAVAHDSDAVREARRERLLLLSPVEHMIAHMGDVDAARAQAFGDHRGGEVRDADETRATRRHNFVQGPQRVAHPVVRGGTARPGELAEVGPSAPSR